MKAIKDYNGMGDELTYKKRDIIEQLYHLGTKGIWFIGKNEDGRIGEYYKSNFKWMENFLQIYWHKMLFYSS